VAFSPDGKTIAAGYGGGVVMWDVTVSVGKIREVNSAIPERGCWGPQENSPRRA
jgi:hypothetical protein